jgi:hypothetical protein
MEHMAHQVLVDMIPHRLGARSIRHRSWSNNSGCEQGLNNNQSDYEVDKTLKFFRTGYCSPARLPFRHKQGGCHLQGAKILRFDSIALSRFAWHRYLATA